ncbi:hypothetical protein V1525DRAFT_228807 [Lipomyces kononenkoae]|uniref:Uncharacterized protein n=1 Tax=Lipomyces kononenkoae TaxID=34357 RepID=A0ACC3T8W1_LIPKO
MPSSFLSRKKRTPPASRSAAVAVFGESAFSLIDEDTLSPEESLTLDSDNWMLAYTDSAHSYPDSRRLSAATARSVFDPYQSRPHSTTSRFASLRRLSSQLALQQPRSQTSSTTSLSSATGGKQQQTTSLVVGPAEPPSGSGFGYGARARPVDNGRPGTEHPRQRGSPLALPLHQSHSSPLPQPHSHLKPARLHHFATAPIPRAASTSSTASSTSSSSSSASPNFRSLNPRGRADHRSKSNLASYPPFSPIPESPRNSQYGNIRTYTSNASKAQIPPPPGLDCANSIHDRSSDMTTELFSERSPRSHLCSSYTDVIGDDRDGADPAAAASATASDAVSSATASLSSRVGSPIATSPPRVSSPASSMIFERHVQDPVLTPSGVPSHHHSENLIPPVLAASCEALTDESVDPDEVEVVSITRPYSNSIHRTNSALSLASIASSVPSLPPMSPKSSSSAALSTGPAPAAANTTHRLSFYTYADVVHDAMAPTDEQLPSPLELPTPDANASHRALFPSSTDTNAESEVSSPVIPDSAHVNGQQQYVTVTTLGEAIRRTQDEITNSA